MTAKQLIKLIKKERRLRSIVESGNRLDTPIVQYNFWQIATDESWLVRFMRHRGILTDKKISLYSVFGDRNLIKFDKRDVKMFVTGENVHFGDFKIFSDNMLVDKEIDLSMGFDYFDDERYIRFPLWLRTQFMPEMSEKDIIQRVQNLRYPTIGERKKFACLISRYDWGGTRSAIYEKLQHIGMIHCPSKVLHNDDSLISEYGDEKNAYMQQFCFNICPENSNAYGYVTEKIFDAIYAGCIPIYWGSYNEPEKEILNQDAIIFWNKDTSNEEVIHKIDELCHDKKKLMEFMHQVRLNDRAEEVIVNFFNLLEMKMKALL